MRSILFGSTDIDTKEEFRKDFGLLLKLDSSGLEALLEELARLLLAGSRRERRDIIGKLGERLAVETRVLASAGEVLLFLANRFVKEEKESVEDLVADLRDVGLLPDERVDDFRSFLSGIRDQVEAELRLADLEKRTLASGAKNLRGIGAVVDFRPVIPNYYETGTDIASYDPICKGFAPVIMVSLKLDDDTVYFQLDERDLKELVDHLTAAQKVVETGRKMLGS